MQPLVGLERALSLTGPVNAERADTDMEQAIDSAETATYRSQLRVGQVLRERFISCSLLMDSVESVVPFQPEAMADHPHVKSNARMASYMRKLDQGLQRRQRQGNLMLKQAKHDSLQKLAEAKKVIKDALVGGGSGGRFSKVLNDAERRGSSSRGERLMSAHVCISPLSTRGLQPMQGLAASLFVHVHSISEPCSECPRLKSAASE